MIEPREVTASTLVVALTGEYDISRTAALRDAILAPLEYEELVIADVSGVTFMDSTALTSLLEVRRVLEERGATLALTNPTPAVARLLEITETARLFGLAPPD